MTLQQSYENLKVYNDQNQQIYQKKAKERFDEVYSYGQFDKKESNYGGSGSETKDVISNDTTHHQPSGESSPSQLSHYHYGKTQLTPEQLGRYDDQTKALWKANAHAATRSDEKLVVNPQYDFLKGGVGSRQEQREEQQRKAEHEWKSALANARHQTQIEQERPPDLYTNHSQLYHLNLQMQKRQQQQQGSDVVGEHSQREVASLQEQQGSNVVGEHSQRGGVASLQELVVRLRVDMRQGLERMASLQERQGSNMVGEHSPQGGVASLQELVARLRVDMRQELIAGRKELERVAKLQEQQGSNVVGEHSPQGGVASLQELVAKLRVDMRQELMARLQELEKVARLQVTRLQELEREASQREARQLVMRLQELKREASQREARLQVARQLVMRLQVAREQ